MVINVGIVVIIAALTYTWAQEFSGSWALFTAVFVLLLPTHASESPLTSLVAVLVIVSLVEFVLHPTRSWTLLLGVALGVAQLVSLGAWLWYLYAICMVVLFFIISFVRDREVTAYAHLNRFGIRLRAYLALFAASGTISVAVWYIGVGLRAWLFEKMPPLDAFIFGYHSIIAQLVHPLVVIPHTFADLTAISIPGLVIIALGLLLLVAHDVPAIMHRKLTHWLPDIYPALALIVFVALYWRYGVGVTPIAIALGMLISEPLRQLLTRRYSKELLIVIGHERLSFSARWLVFGGLVVWYVVNSIAIYL